MTSKCSHVPYNFSFGKKQINKIWVLLHLLSEALTKGHVYVMWRCYIRIVGSQQDQNEEKNKLLFGRSTVLVWSTLSCDRAATNPKLALSLSKLQQLLPLKWTCRVFVWLIDVMFVLINVKNVSLEMGRWPIVNVFNVRQDDVMFWLTR